MTRKFEFDAGHRVMNQNQGCGNAHGHRYVVELQFEFDDHEALGYALDFKEIKRIGCQWIDDNMDHGFILNPQDKLLIETYKQLGLKTYVISLNGENYCNPTAENISKEIYLAMEIMFKYYNSQSNMVPLNIKNVRLYETPNCYVDCVEDSINDTERMNFVQNWGLPLIAYVRDKGVMQYDDRKNFNR